MLEQSAHYLTPIFIIYSFCGSLSVYVLESCSWQSTVYRDGEEWKPSLCSRCVCTNGETQCSVAECQQVACKPVSFWKYTLAHTYCVITLKLAFQGALYLSSVYFVLIQKAEWHWLKKKNGQGTILKCIIDYVSHTLLFKIGLQVYLHKNRQKWVYFLWLNLLALFPQLGITSWVC